MTFLFFFTASSTTEIYTLSLHDALPISGDLACCETFHDEDLTGVSIEYLQRIRFQGVVKIDYKWDQAAREHKILRSEEHTSELQSLTNLVCRLLLEKKKNNNQRK